MPGLLHFCGIESEKQPGQLKRTSGPLLSFVRWLLHQTDDIYLNNFVRLSPEELVKINFPKHILNQNESSKLGITIGRQSRGGHADDAFELLHILYQDHRNAEDEQDPIDINFLLHNDSVCYDRFHAWLQKSNLDFVSEINTCFHFPSINTHILYYLLSLSSKKNWLIVFGSRESKSYLAQVAGTMLFLKQSLSKKVKMLAQRM